MDNFTEFEGRGFILFTCPYLPQNRAASQCHLYWGKWQAVCETASVFYGIHPQRHIVDQTNQCDAKSNKYRFTHLEWYAVHEPKGFCP